MKKELQSLSSQLRRLGFNSYASKVSNMINKEAWGNKYYQYDENSSLFEDELLFKSYDYGTKLRNVIRNTLLPPTGKETGDFAYYNVDSRSYINFLEKELSIEMPGLISVSGEAKINLNDLSDEIIKMYNQMSKIEK